MKINDIFNIFYKQISIFFKNSVVFYFLFFFTLSFYIRLDAELMIFWSVLLVLFTIWKSLSDFLANILNIKTTLFYFYFIRFYQGRLWFIYMSYKFFSLNLFTLKLPFFFKWHKFYSQRLFDLINKLGFDVLKNWDIFLNYNSFNLLQITMGLVWLSFYKSVFNMYFLRDNSLSQLNSRKITEYVVLNKDCF